MNIFMNPWSYLCKRMPRAERFDGNLVQASPKLLTGLVLAVSLAVAGAVVLGQQAAGANQPRVRHEGEPKPAAQKSGRSRAAVDRPLPTDRRGDPLPPGA